MKIKSELINWIIAIAITLLVVGGTILHARYAIKVDKLIHNFINTEYPDYAWFVYPDGTMIAHPSMKESKVDIFQAEDGRQYAIIPTGDTLYFKKTNQ